MRNVIVSSTTVLATLSIAIWCYGPALRAQQCYTIGASGTSCKGSAYNCPEGCGNGLQTSGADDGDDPMGRTPSDTGFNTNTKSVGCSTPVYCSPDFKLVSQCDFGDCEESMDPTSTCTSYTKSFGTQHYNISYVEDTSCGEG